MHLFPHRYEKIFQMSDVESKFRGMLHERDLGICKTTSKGQRRCKTKEKGQQVPLCKMWFKDTYLWTERCLGQSHSRKTCSYTPKGQESTGDHPWETIPEEMFETRCVSQLQPQSRSRMSCPQRVLKSMVKREERIYVCV